MSRNCTVTTDCVTDTVFEPCALITVGLAVIRAFAGDIVSGVPTAVTVARVTEPVAMVTVRVFVPIVVLSCHDPTDATPLPSVTADADPTEPLPLALKNTVTPVTVFPN